MGVYYGMNGLWVPVGGQGGTAPIDPNLLAENIKSGVAISGVTGTFTNDATAVASDMAEGVTAYVNGEKVTGNLPEKTGSQSFFNSTPSFSQATSMFNLINEITADQILRTGAKLYFAMNTQEFGDATAADVASGKTFTSKNGLKVTGTGSVSSGEVNTSEQSVSYKNTISITCGFKPSAVVINLTDLTLDLSSSSATNYIMVSLFIVRDGPAQAVYYHVSSSRKDLFARTYTAEGAASLFGLTWSNTGVSLQLKTSQYYFDGDYTITCIP